MRQFAALALILLNLVAAGCAGLVSLPAPTAAPTVAPSAVSSSTPRPLGTIRFFDLVNLDVRDVPLLMAMDSLRAQGYTIETTYLASGALITESLARGDADISMVNNQTIWTAISKGADLRTIAQFTGSTTVFAARREIDDCRALDGKPVGVAATRGVSPSLFGRYLKEQCAGAEPQLVVIPESAGRVAGLVAGELDAAVMPGEAFYQVEEQAPGRFHPLMTYAESFPDVQIDGLHVRREWAGENPEAVKDFLRAMLKAYREVSEEPQVLYEEAAKRLSLDPAVARSVGDSDLQLGIWDANGGLTAENLQYTLDFLKQTDDSLAELRVEDVADLSYLNAVLDEIGRK
jgi:ABC-type nitrate/sulfonate/bicarbonate transport system substrate-binding protein